MKSLRGLVARLRHTLLRRRVDADMDEELRFHIEMETEKNIGLGLEPREARRRALLAFGGVERHREELRHGRTIPVLDGAAREFRFAVRSLRRTLGMSTSIVVALALGIGVCTVIYSFGGAVVTDAVPFPDPDRLFSIELASQGRFASPTFEEFEALMTRLPGTVDLAAHSYTSQSIGTASARVEAWSLRVTAEFFPILQPRVLLGRPLLASDWAGGGPRVATISEPLWGELFGADTSAIGRTLYLGGEAHALVGVVAGGQAFPPIVDVWVPMLPGGIEADRGVGIIGRMPTGWDPEDARGAVESVRPAQAGDLTASRIVVLPLTGRENPAARPAFLLLWIAVGSIMLIGVANATGLMVTRSLVRAHEIAVRRSLGASEGRILVGRLVESLLLAASAATLGVLVAWLGVEALQRLMPASVSRQLLGWEQLGPDGSMLGFAAALALVAGAICGSAPRVGAWREVRLGALQGTPARATPSRRATRALDALVAGEVAISLALLISAGLLARSLQTLVAVDPGFAVDNFVAMSWALPEEATSAPEGVRAEQERWLTAVETWAGARPWAVSSGPPVAGAGLAATRAYRLPTSDPDSDDGRAIWQSVSPGYIEALQIPLRRGRLLSTQDGPEAPRVAVVTESLAERHWPGESAVGRDLAVGEDRWSIVGVVGDVRTFRSGENVEPAIYVPQAQAPTRRGYMLVGRAASLSSMREELWSAAPDVALGPPATLREMIDGVYAGQRVLAVLVGAYAAAALLITLISLYAVVGHLVVRHQREYGVRVALGASPGHVVRRATWRGLRAATLGGLTGVVLAAALAQLMASFLVDLRVGEPLVFVGLPLAVLLLAALAAYLPARKAARQEPAAILGV